jgi:digeranylgeranylglycerophospholipid reductase
MGIATRDVDVLVVGAGPAGIAAAQHLRAGGADVMLIDCEPRIGAPLRCAELTRDSFYEHLGLPRRDGWQRWKLDDGMIVLNREQVEGESARLLAAAGVEVRAGSAAVAIEPYDGERRAVLIERATERQRVRTRLVLAADGVASRMARLAGIDTKLSPHESVSTLAYRVEDVTIDAGRMLMDQALDLSPHYFWVIPIGARAANVGLGVPAHRGHALDPLLRQRMRRLEGFAEARVVERVVGWYPSTLPVERPYTDGVLVLGTAARLIGATTGEGIWHAAKSGLAAARTFLASAGRSRASDLAPYRPALEDVYQECVASWRRRRTLELHGQRAGTKH